MLLYDQSTRGEQDKPFYARRQQNKKQIPRIIQRNGLINQTAQLKITIIHLTIKIINAPLIKIDALLATPLNTSQETALVRRIPKIKNYLVALL
jgi:hypothetical protein